MNAAQSALIGPGIAGMGVKSVQADSKAWSASAANTLEMGKGIKPGTLLGHRLQLILAYSAAPGAVGYTAQEYHDFYTAILPIIQASTTVRPLVASAASGMSGGEVTLLNQLGARAMGGGSLESAGGSITLGASGVLVFEVPLYHYNALTGLSRCPDTSLFKNIQLSYTTGAAAPSLGGTTITFSNGQVILWADYLDGVPGSTSHLRWDRYDQTGETDTLPPAFRLCHLVTGGSDVFADYIDDLAVAGTVTPAASGNAFQVLADGRPTFDFGGGPGLNNAAVWLETLRRASRGAVGMPFAFPYGAEPGLASLKCVPLYVPAFEAAGEGMTGEIVVKQATNLLNGTRRHLSLIVGGV